MVACQHEIERTSRSHSRHAILPVLSYSAPLHFQKRLLPNSLLDLFVAEGTVSYNHPSNDTYEA